MGNETMKISEVVAPDMNGRARTPATPNQKIEEAL